MGRLVLGSCSPQQEKKIDASNHVLYCLLLEQVAQLHGGHEVCSESTIVPEGFKGGTRGAPIMPRDTVSRTANVGTVGMNMSACLLRRGLRLQRSGGHGSETA